MLERARKEEGSSSEMLRIARSMKGSSYNTLQIAQKMYIARNQAKNQETIDLEKGKEIPSKNKYSSIKECEYKQLPKKCSSILFPYRLNSGSAEGAIWTALALCSYWTG